jgi:hypothetical protein
MTAPDRILRAAVYGRPNFACCMVMHPTCKSFQFLSLWPDMRLNMARLYSTHGLVNVVTKFSDKQNSSTWLPGFNSCFRPEKGPGNILCLSHECQPKQGTGLSTL